MAYNAVQQGAAGVDMEEKSSCIWIFCCLSSLRFMVAF